MRDGQRQLTRAREVVAETARRDLRRWGKVNAERDHLVCEAARCGVGVNEITRLTGLAKTTLIRILGAGRQLAEAHRGASLPASD
jgi:hypothetical protein